MESAERVVWLVRESMLIVSAFGTCPLACSC